MDVEVVLTEEDEIIDDNNGEHTSNISYIKTDGRPTFFSSSISSRTHY